MIEAVVSGALANVVSDVLSEMARRLGIARRAVAERQHGAELDLATYFDTYSFTEEATAEIIRRLITTIGVAEEETVIRRLGSDRCHAVLHELLAVRLTDAPEQQLDRLRSSFSHALWPLGALDREAAHEIADAAFEYFDDRLSEVVAHLEGALPETAGRLRDRAIGHRIVAILDAIERHEAASGDEGDYAADQTFLARYRHHLVEEFGTLTPPDLQQRRRIPIEDLYVPPNIAAIPSEYGFRNAQAPSPLLTHFAAGIDRTVLLGDPGAGKTTAARALIHAYARDDAAVIPFLVTLRDFTADGEIIRSVVQHIEHEMDVVYQCAPPRGWVQRRLLDGAALVTFDGLDELVDTGRRAQISRVIEHFCIEYPLARVLVTSRFVGYDQASLDEREFIRYRIDRFDDEQVGGYAHKWFASDRTLKADRAAKDADAFVVESASVPDLRSNPLMLSLMCVLYRGEGYIPQHRAQVYRMCAELLFHRWDASRHIHVALTLSQAQVQRLLRALAHWLLTRDDTGTAVTERVLVVRTAELLLERDMDQPEQAEAVAAQFVAFCHGRGWIFVDVGTTPAGEPLYAFAHRTFLEYFAAGHLAAHADTPEALAMALTPRLVRGEWDVIAQLAIAMKDDAVIGGGQRTLQALFRNRRARSERAHRFLLLLAISTLDALDLTTDYVKSFTQQLLDFILDPDTDFEVRDEMLAWCRMNLRRWRELVAAEFTARAETLIGSGDPRVRALGLRLGAGDVYPVRSRVEVGSLPFWVQWAHANALAWRDTIERDAAGELSVLHLGLDQGLLSMRETLAQANGITLLTASTRDPLLGYYHGSWLGLRTDSVRLDPTRTGFALRVCRELGDYLLNDKPRPPFAEPMPWPGRAPDGYSGSPLVEYASVGEAVYLAVAVMSAIDIETWLRGGDAGSIAPIDKDGWLSAFIPYAHTRRDAGKAAPIPLAPLPMREDYQQLFRAWAYHEVDFVAFAAIAPEK